MFGPKRALVVVLPILGLAGCATSGLKMAPTRPDRPWTPETTATGEIVPGARPRPLEGPGSYVLPSNSELASLPPPLTLAEEKACSLAELIDIAESNNLDTREAWNNARHAALTAGIAESTYLPYLSIGALGGYQVTGGSTSSGGVNVGNTASAPGVVVGASLQWLLFDFGEREARIDAAKQLSVISNINFTAAHQLVVRDVSVAFYAHAAAVAHVATAVEALKNAQEVQAAAEDRFKHGIGTTVEVAQARQATAQAQLARVQAEGAQQNAYLTLLSAMGISPLTTIRIAPLPERRLRPELGESVEQMVTAALARRPDILSAFAERKASQATVRAARAAFLPKFFISGIATYSFGQLDITAVPAVGELTPSINLAQDLRAANILGGVIFSLFDGGVHAAALVQAEERADNADLALTRKRNEAVRDVVFAVNALRTSLASSSAAASVVSAAQTTFDAALAAYRNGVGTITDVVMAETQLVQARNADIDAYSATLSTAATLALRTGTIGAAP